MKEAIINSESMLNGFFYFFGFLSNPAEKSAKETIAESPGEKIRGDLRRINKDYRDSYNQLRKDIFSIGQ